MTNETEQLRRAFNPFGGMPYAYAYFKLQNPETLPEALVALNAPAITPAHRDAFIHQFLGFTPPEWTNVDKALAECSAKIGRYTFSFPQWRFLTQSFNGASLVERFGMERLYRDNDVRDESLPKSDPQRDHFGPGFAIQDKDLYVEYRRAYIAVSDGDTTIVIRNSSHYFGRDRLPEVAYVSFEGLTPEEIQGLRDEDFTNGRPFKPWNKDVVHPAVVMALDETRRVRDLLRRLDEFDMKLHKWLLNEGVNDVIEFTEHALARNKQAGKTDPPFYFVCMDAQMPPFGSVFYWPASENTAAELTDKNTFNGTPRIRPVNGTSKVVLLTSWMGDWPAAPKTP
ncbi:MAG: hypothetical protein GC136_00070 [Alphaproteobacteria bacterium]|nr:hypothetical protein [Alphaproteobacteria bacterium]